MASLKSRFIELYLRHTRKKAFSSAAAFRARIKSARRRETHQPPRRLAAKVDIEHHTLHGIPVYEVRPRNLQGLPRGKRILYFHGGAYVFEITPHHWHLIAELACRLDAHITVPIYRLAPEYTFDDIFGPVRALYREVVRKTPPDRFVLIGDSAGAHMAVVLTMMAAKENLPRADRLVLISPGLDMSTSNPRLRELEKADPWLGIEGGMEAVRLYAPGFSLRDWRVSPVFGDLSVLPRSLVLTGTRDMLSADVQIFVDKARQEGADVELVIGQNMIHVWPLIDMPESRPARDRIVDFVSDGDDGPSPMPGSRVRPAAARETSPS